VRYIKLDFVNHSLTGSFKRRRFPNAWYLELGVQFFQFGKPEY
jgi:hypothetical protein